MSVVRLSERVRRELNYLSYPSREWVAPHFRAGRRVLDVLIVGAGQAGLAVAFGLKLERITNIRIVDRNARGQEGPWRRFARMRQLRTFKDVTGIDLGIPNLTLRAWYEAKFGREAWDRIHKIPPERWHDYLAWYRDVLELPVENGTEVTAIAADDDLLFAELRHNGRSERVHARKIVLATGIDGSGTWRAPAMLANLPPDRYARASDDIDFSRCAGKRVGILGAGASALDNAAAALEAGAASVELCLRRAEIPRINPLFWTNFAGMLGHFAELSDLERWRFMRQILEQLPIPPPQESFWRCRSFKNFSFRTDCSWRSLRLAGGAVVVETNADSLHFDFIILATGVEIDLCARAELAPIAHQIALWRHRFKPPPGEESDLLASYPYLGPAFEFMEREPGSAPYLARLHAFNFGATLSLGITGAAITGMKYGVPRLVNGLARNLFREDAAEYYRDLLAYDVAELQTLESPFAWIDRLAAEALNPQGLINELHHAGLGKVLQGKRAQNGSSKAPGTARANAGPAPRVATQPPAREKRKRSRKRPRVEI
jgi:FAD-dependent urate hydroxylase